MDGVSLAQTYLTGHCKTEVLHLLIRDLPQITPLETVLTNTVNDFTISASYQSNQVQFHSCSKAGKRYQLDKSLSNG